MGSTVCSHSPAYTQCQILCCYTCGSVSAGATYPCRATLWHVATEGTCEFRYSVQFIFVGPVCNNVLTNRAALLCRTLLRVTRLCSRNVSDPANMRIHGAQSASMRKKKSSAVLLFEAVADLWSAPDSPRERGDSQEGGNRRCLPSCAPARRQRKSPLRFSENLPPVRGEHAYAVRVP